MNDTLTLRPDGTGLHVSRSAFSGTQRTALVWRHLAEGRLAIVALQEGETADSISDDMWEPVEYVAAWQANDASQREPVLKNRTQDGFWSLLDPVQLVGRSG